MYIHICIHIVYDGFRTSYSVVLLNSGLPADLPETFQILAGTPNLHKYEDSVGTVWDNVGTMWGQCGDIGCGFNLGFVASGSSVA